MIKVFLDIESYYDWDVSLTRLSPLEYILHPKFHVLATSVAIEHEDPMFLPQDEVTTFLAGMKQPYCVITHNALFDACVLSYHYNIHPTGLLDTLGMSRALISHLTPQGKVSLAMVLKHLGLTEKGRTIDKMRGKAWLDLQRNPELMMEFVGYALNDVVGCRDIFYKLRPLFPPAEAMIMDRVIRMTTRPMFRVNVAGLLDYADELLFAKRDLLARVGYNVEVLRSNQQFAEVLRSLGVEPPVKISAVTDKETLAMAKSDDEFMALTEHPNPAVQAVMAARLGVKTTIEETRAARFAAIGNAALIRWGEALMPAPLKYSGAHTHRLSGDWKLNMQNLGSRKNRTLRSCLLAPFGYTIISVDAKQIEARLTAWLAKQWDLVKAFKDKIDVYSEFAKEIFNVEQASRLQRFVGKTCILGLGFGMGDYKLLWTLKLQAYEQGYDPNEFTLESCIDWVQAYRRKYLKITYYRELLNHLIERMASGTADGELIGPCRIEGQEVVMPGGLRLYYNDLAVDAHGDWRYTSGGKRVKMYGGRLLENVVQALDRQHVMDTMIRTEFRIHRELGIDGRAALNEHDSNVYIVPDKYVEAAVRIAWEEMARTPAWGKYLYLGAEVKIGKDFGNLEELQIT